MNTNLNELTNVFLTFSNQYIKLKREGKKIQDELMNEIIASKYSTLVTNVSWYSDNQIQFFIGGTPFYICVECNEIHYGKINAYFRTRLNQEASFSDVKLICSVSFDTLGNIESRFTAEEPGFSTLYILNIINAYIALIYKNEETLSLS